MKQDWKETVLSEVKRELETLEAQGKAPKDIAELESLTIKMSQKVGQRTWEEWMKSRAKEAHFPP